MAIVFNPEENILYPQQQTTPIKPEEEKPNIINVFDEQVPGVKTANDINVFDEQVTEVKSENINIAQALTQGKVTDNGLGVDIKGKPSVPTQKHQVAATVSAPDTTTPKGNAEDLVTNIDKIKKDNGYVESKPNQFGDENERARKRMEMEFSGEFMQADSQLAMTLMKENRGSFNPMEAMEALDFVKQNVGKSINLSSNENYQNFNQNQQNYVKQAIKEISGNDAISDKDFQIKPKEDYKIFSKYAELFE